MQYKDPSSCLFFLPSLLELLLLRVSLARTLSSYSLRHGSVHLVVFTILSIMERDTEQDQETCYVSNENDSISFPRLYIALRRF
jgi:hypothetical protein